MSATTFTYTRSGEPHIRRRVEILAKYPEIRKLSGVDRWTAVVTVVVGAAHLGIAAVIGALPAWALVLFSYFVGAVLMHWLAMAIHESSHNLVFRTKVLNRWIALVANIPCVIPIAMSFHRYHVEHHVYLGVDDGDADLPVPLEVRAIGASRWRKFLWLLFYAFVYPLRGVVYARKPTGWEVFNFVTQTAITVALGFWLGGAAMAYLTLSMLFGLALHPVAAHFIHEHYVFAPERGQETYSYYGPLNAVTFNVGYHNEHHDFMNVPGSRLKELHAIAREHYSDLVSHRSWTWVLWHFITSPAMGAGSRIVRTREDFLRARGKALRAESIAAKQRVASEGGTQPGVEPSTATQRDRVAGNRPLTAAESEVRGVECPV